jgi:hypothetical protein
LVVLLLLLEFADVVVEGELPHQLTADEDGGCRDVHVHQRAVLSRPARGEMHALLGDALADLHGLLVNLSAAGHQVIDVAADGFVRGVAEQPLGRRIP